MCSYKLRIIGHSLGAGAGCLICYMINTDLTLMEEFEGIEVECCGIATPPVLNRELAMGCRDSITSLILEVRFACLITNIAEAVPVFIQQFFVTTHNATDSRVYSRAHI